MTTTDHRPAAGPRPSAIRARRPALTAAALAAAGLGIAAAPAGAFVYWGNSARNAIGRANLDGTAVARTFLPLGAATPNGVAVDAHHIYWTDPAHDTIGRANLDGSHADPTFITGADNPCGVAVDTGHIYWANDDTFGSIGRANLDGSGVDQGFVASQRGSGSSDLNEPCGVAVDAAYVYWADTNQNTIARASVATGQGAAQFIGGASVPRGVAVAAGHIYWANDGTGTIGRANLDGSGVTQDLVTGANGPCGVAVDAGHIYWANSGYGRSGTTIGRALLDGSGALERLVTGANDPCGVAVDTGFAGVVRVVGNRSLAGGRVWLRVRVSGRGPVVVTQAGGRGRLVATARRRARKAGILTIVLAPTAAGRRTLPHTGVFVVRARVTFTPAGGLPGAAVATLRLRR